MDCVKTLLKIAAALAAVAGALFVVYKYWDKIMEKIDELKSKCPCCKAPADEMDEPAEEEAPETEEAPAEEAAEPSPEAGPEVTEADFAD